MSLDTDVQSPETQADTSAPIVQGAEPLADQLQDTLSDPLVEGSEGDAVQMILPPKPGAGPKETDAFSSVEDLLAQDADLAN